MVQWNRNAAPECKDRTCSDEVLVTILKYGTYKKVLKAVYVPYHHCTFKDMDWEMYKGVPYDYDYEYNEEEDTWWIPQGWYKVCDYLEDCPHIPITSEVIAWMRLSKEFEPNINELN